MRLELCFYEQWKNKCISMLSLSCREFQIRELLQVQKVNFTANHKHLELNIVIKTPRTWML